ncbi:hypothetical protein JYU34_000407 [Plutella xylostella]|uniref:Uncharacterized protein n=1 Tax=Plutella xylostella TaxID=51655 RepID=A0ABQ7R7M2_PLUXY|nr:hypothetical protein JYU34_000407 [Plutella xylostella]
MYRYHRGSYKQQAQAGLDARPGRQRRWPGQVIRGQEWLLRLRQIFIRGIRRKVLVIQQETRDPRITVIQQ